MEYYPGEIAYSRRKVNSSVVDSIYQLNLCLFNRLSAVRRIQQSRSNG